MKKSLLIICALAASLMVMGQQSPTAPFFRNHAEYLQYQMDHPDQIPLVASVDRAIFSQKLDSVIGSDDFDRTRWKNEYVFSAEADENGENQYNAQNYTEIAYVWDNGAWRPDVKTVSTVDGLESKHEIYQWNGEAWEQVSYVNYTYEMIGEEKLLSDVIQGTFFDTVWIETNRSAYEYDALGHLLRNVTYTNSDDEWVESTKYEYVYNEEGNLIERTYYTIRNGSWRDRSKDTLSYDDQHRCVMMLMKTKGGFGPGANLWRDSGKYEFSYEDGRLVTETYYSAGWFSTEMALESKMEYQYDAQGNLQQKNASIYNGADWIVRDQYENRFDVPVEAASILGLASVWETTLGKGMGNALGLTMPVFSKWNSCSIISTQLDTQFNLYYSGFATVDDDQPSTFKAYATGGRLIVESPEPVEVTVYDLLGHVVSAQSSVTREEITLRPGFYFVASGKNVVKTVVQ